eukprot:GHVH01006126.1.p1 GENE.GHVH01006126.1~~GHVH01006126.1.p1  ORF type:complete len:391 (+),score=58.10 GHVH01006126.1:106-1278(+)
MSTSAGLNAGNRLANCNAIKKLSEREIQQNLFDPDKSWHKQYKDSAYIFIGGIKSANPEVDDDKSLTEGDIATVFSQWGDVYDVNLVRDHTTGKPRGFGFVGYEDARSCAIAVDNANGMKLCGRVLTVDHVKEFRAPRPRPPPAEEDECKAGASTGDGGVAKKNMSDINFWRTKGKADDQQQSLDAQLRQVDYMTVEEQAALYKPSGPEGVGPNCFLVIPSVAKRYDLHQRENADREQRRLDAITSEKRGLNQVILGPAVGSSAYEEEQQLNEARAEDRRRQERRDREERRDEEGGSRGNWKHGGRDSRRDGRSRDDRSRDDRSRDDRSRDDRSRDNRGRDDRSRDNRGRDNRGRLREDDEHHDHRDRYQGRKSNSDHNRDRGGINAPRW